MIRDRINSDLKEATLAKEKCRVATLRLINATIKDRDIAARGNGKERVGDDELLQILAKMIKQREESAQVYEEAGRLEMAQQERDEMVIINTYLPRQMDDEEIHAAIAEVMTELNAQGLRDMGKCMGALKARYPGQMDFAKASAKLKELLK